MIFFFAVSNIIRFYTFFDIYVKILTMISVPETVEDIVKNSPFLIEALQQNLLNLSELARKMQPEIEKRLYKSVTVPSIFMALKRLQFDVQKTHITTEVILKNLEDITIRSNLVQYTFISSTTLREKQTILLQTVKNSTSVFLTITSGVFETTFIANKKIEGEIERIFEGEQLKNKTSALSSITIITPEEAVYIPGILYSVLKRLAWEGINVIEVVSTYTEFTVVLENNNLNKAFNLLKNF